MEALFQSNMSEMNINDFNNRGGRLYCIGYNGDKNNKCHKNNNPQPYNDVDIASHCIGSDAFDMYRNAQHEYIRSTTQQTTLAEYKAREEALKAETLFEKQVKEARDYITNDILTLRCPNPNGCSQAFYDFTNCFAIECSRCRKEFCGWCLQYCGNDAHEHVRKCKYNMENGKVYSTVAKFEQSNHRRRILKLHQYLRSLNINVAKQVVKLICGILKEMNLYDEIDYKYRY